MESHPLPEQGMVSKSIFRPILDNEAVTRGLGDAEARILIEWLVTQAEKMSAREKCVEKVRRAVEQLCRRARVLTRFVVLWNSSRASACQLAATERFCWPLPTTTVDPCELMLDILSYEPVDEESMSTKQPD
jgi:hypothetical protein